MTEGLRPVDELRSLRRVATLVAEEVPPQQLFTVVASEVAEILEVPMATVLRYEPDGTVTTCARSEKGPPLEIGTRFALDGPSVLGRIRATGRAARIDDYSMPNGELPDAVRAGGGRAAVGTPIVVSGRLWGAVVVSNVRAEPLPRGTEERLADFTELLATAIANAESRTALERLAEEQAALRRVATLVAQGVPEIFSAVSDEVEGLFGCGAVVMKFDNDLPGVVFAGVSKSIDIPVGSRWEFQDGMSSAEVYRTGKSARVDEVDWSTRQGAYADVSERLGVVSTAASPIIVQGRPWGAMTLASSDRLLPLDIEERLEKFTELIASAIANAEASEALERVIDEQTALRRVATLVARGVPAGEVFQAVSEEVASVFGESLAAVGRSEADGSMVTIVGIATQVEGLDVGTRVHIHEETPTGMAYATRRSARVDREDWSDAVSELGHIAHQLGVVSWVTSPVVVESRLWGYLSVAARQPLPPETERRLEKFTELVATAIANAESKSELAAALRRVVTASDEARSRIERNLHDGTQQRLVALALAVRAVEADPPAELTNLRSELSRIAAGLVDAMTELQEISRGIHPANLSEGGLAVALRTLARRSPIPVDLDLDITSEERLPESIEVAAFYVTSEALANAAKHAQASRVEVSLAARDNAVFLSIRDDGAGGADPAGGSGLVGLTDRVDALGGSLEIRSTAGHGTRIIAKLPLRAEPGDILD